MNLFKCYEYHKATTDVEIDRQKNELVDRYVSVR